MDNNHDAQELELDDILKECQDLAQDIPEEVEADEELQDFLSVTPMQPEQILETAAEAEAETAALVQDATVRLDTLSEITPASAAKEDGPHFIMEQTMAIPGEEPVFQEPIIFAPPRSRLRELKRKLIAGPEKRYYDLAEIGVGKLQFAVFLNLLIVLLCAGATTLFAMGMVPENRLRLVIFSQVLAMMVSALLGTHLIIDGVADLLRGRFCINTMLAFTFLACCADAVFCLVELRVPCCAAFSLEMAMALWGSYHRRSTEMAQMDTMRKAVRLNSIVKVPDFYEGRPGIVRGEGQVEDFMDTYDLPSGPEVFQGAYCFVSLLLCIGIAVFVGMRHCLSLALQILSTSLLVAVPASFFIALTRPMAILERRLHMVGTVLCGWQGVKKLCGKAVFPLTDTDLFPAGATKLNGVKFYGDLDPDQVVSFTASLITAGGGGLVSVFQQLLKSRSGRIHKVENFQTYGGGGIGGEIYSVPVLLGNLSFLQDMGVEIPEGTMVNQAVYAAIDGQLSGVFAISYAKMRSSAAGIVTLCGYRKILKVITCGDFMLTESFLRSKFNISTRKVRFPDRETRVALAQQKPDGDAVALALTTREDLVSTAYAVTGARSLRTASILGVLIHVLGGFLGMLIMLALGYLGSTELLTPTHVLLYQLVWMLPGLLITEWTRNV